VAARRWASVIVGILLLIFGTVFALQGANVIGGSAFMSGNSTYIYVGGVLAIIGLILMIVGSRSRSKAPPISTRAGTVPSATISSPV
jgi:uncharacterized membrane protein YphA (DoxX/SURF4 family)